MREIPYAPAAEIRAVPGGLGGFEAGEGPTLVMLHGFAPGIDSRTEFAAQVDAFAARHRVLLLDLPGFGASADLPVTDCYTREAVERLQVTLEALGVAHADVLGLSLGGWVALQAALDVPALVDRLVLAAPGTLVAGDDGLRTSEGVRKLSAFLARPSSLKMLEWLETQFADPASITDKMVEDELARAMQVGAIARLRAVRRSFEGAESDPPLWSHSRQVHQRSLLLWGRENVDFPLDSVLHGARRIPRGDLHVMAGCAQRAHQEQPDEFNQLVAQFLAR
ncbi:alpha/beta fold hydrolase [Nocardioides sp. W7]|uniref:alpha/beta fold hydrolase n=1 Tax=Nocardioides sp. W7 TaxID=2931390 RepID=UPI001FD273D7|nr:alpha/beta fold hydrolase [Nocardioides sp. W7]